MRNFLCTKFCCAKCGNVLELSYYAPKTTGYVNTHAKDMPTGAAMVEQTVYVQVCKTCLAPMAEINKAVEAFNKYNAAKEIESE